MENNGDIKKKFLSKRNILIIFGGLLIFFILCLAYGTYLNSTSEGKATNTARANAQATQNALPTITNTPTPLPNTPTPDPCNLASNAQFERINGGIKSVQDTNYIKKAYAIKSDDLANVYFVAAIIYGPGMEEGVGPGIWVISGDPDTPKLSLSVDAFAIEFTNYPDVNTTDFDVPISTHGYSISKECAEKNK